MNDIARLRVLLVEDNELDARGMRRHLMASETTEFDVARVDDLASAVAVIGRDTVDCVLLDLSLPDSEGLASVDAMQQASPKTPIVVLTGLDDPETAVKAVERGAQDYLTKQHADAELVARSIRYAVARHHSEAQLRSAHDMLNTMHDRERIARDLHDTVIQQLFATGMSLQALTGRLRDEQMEERLAHAVDAIDKSIKHLREAIFGLHTPPPPVTLLAEVTEIVDDHVDALGFDPVIRVASDVAGLDVNVRRELLTTLREAMSNVAKHAEATAGRVVVELADGDVVLQVIDNGIGMHAGAPDESAERLTGRGLVNMERRAADLSGDFRIGAGPGGGTKLEWRARLR